MHLERAASSSRSDPSLASDVRKVHRRAIGAYEILFPIAKGGMGSVFASRAPSGEIVAVKLMSEADLSEDAVSAFRREARVTARISHPNVVKTLDLGEHEGLPYLVMELVEGVSVSQILRKAAKEQVSFPPELAAYIALETANGLHAAHSLTDEQGNSVRLVHRDVSPQNILVGYDGTVRVTDFGIAKLSTATHATTTGLVKGKLAYMSPEQTRAEPLDGRSDVFSLGIVLQELLTLKRLFAGDSPAQIVFDVLSRDPELASDVRPDVPRELADVALRCLVKAPSGRYASASDVASALREAMDVSGRAAGGAELAAWMTEFFESERRAFHEQLAVARPEAPIVSAVTATPLETEVTEKDEEPRGVPRRRPGAVIAVAFLSVAVVTGGALVAMRRSTPRSEAPAEATVPGVATPPSPPSTTSAAALPEPSAPEPSAASSAPAATASHSPGVVRPSARPVRSPPKPSPSTTASASKSLRFDTL